MRRSILIACAVAVALRAALAQVDFCDDDVRNAVVLFAVLWCCGSSDGAVCNHGLAPAST